MPSLWKTKREKRLTLKNVSKGREWFWFEEKVSQRPQEHNGGDDNPIPEYEKVTGMDEVDPEETRREQMMSLVERVSSLENKNGEKEQKVKGLEMKIANLERAVQENTEKQAAVARAFTEIAQHVQGQATFKESAQRSIACLENRVKGATQKCHQLFVNCPKMPTFFVNAQKCQQSL